jgi:hypothetical protein
MVHLGFAAALAASATFFALLEIQIEGPHGWARQLPTWRIDNRWTRLVFGSRPMTGYHFYVHLFLLVLLHLPYALGFTAPSWAAEARIAAFWIAFWILEDYLWFVFNPAFGASRFRREHIWWHAPAWWWIMPREYWLGVPIAVALYLLSWR